MKNYLGLIIALFFAFATQAQELSNAKLVRWNKDKTIPVYVLLDGSISVLETEVPRYLSKVYKFPNHTQVKPYQTLEDGIGMRHVRYQVYAHDVPVDGSVLIAHFKDGRLHSYNGEYYGAMTKSHQPNIQEDVALESALSYFKAEKYMWELEDNHGHGMEKELMHKPKGTLYYAESINTQKAQNFVLAYRFNIYAAEPHARKYIFINAEDGAFLKEEDLIHTGDVKGKAVSKYSDTVDIYFDSLAPASYRLRETTYGNGIETYDMNKGTSYGASVDFVNTVQFWDSLNANQDEVAIDAHWGAEQTYVYFFNVHNRRSFDNQDAKIRSYVHRGVNYNNAFWNGSVMTYGDGNGTRFTPLTCIDVCGHEVSHAVTTYSAGLVYAYESGALNESFSDIFGNAIERYARPNKYSYKIGEDITPSGNGIRDMSRPNANGHPDTYKGNLWRTGTGDNGGVHSNSGVQNFWYFILSEGDTGTNDNSDAYSVPGIGYQKAAAVAYRNLTVYLTKNSQYADARYYGIRAAVDLYGDCSSEMIQTTNAWYAVGVGEEYKDSVEVGFEAPKRLFCFTRDTVFFRNLSINASTFLWDFGDGSTSHARNPHHIYNSYGKFSVKLVAGNCNGTKYDSITITDYITIDSSRLVCKSELMPEFGIGPNITDCEGYLMDNGGENDYLTLRTTVRTIAPHNATKVHAKFLQFRMENGYDSLYVYDGPNTASTLLGGFTGNTLPPDLVATSGAMTFKHFADPLVVDSGFIVQFFAEKPPLNIVAPKDTVLCMFQPLGLVAGANGGGDTSEFTYYWTEDNVPADTFKFTPLKDTTLRVYVFDHCMQNYDTAYVQIKVRDTLKLSVSNDTILCFGNTTDLIASATGGDVSNYLFTWDKGLGQGPRKMVDGSSDSLFTVVLSDGCSVENDTATVKVTQLDSLTLILPNDTSLCQGDNFDMVAQGAGGNGNYLYQWSGGLGNGNSKFIQPLTTTRYTITLSDGCSKPVAMDSVLVTVLDSLKITLNKDTVLCIGEAMDLNTLVSGGQPVNYQWTWSNAVGNVDQQTITPSVDTKYSVRLSDGCSAWEPMDSVEIRVRAPLDVNLFDDSTICYGNSINLLATANGGNANQYVYSWDNGLSNQASHVIQPLQTTTYSVVLGDGCTVKSDTAKVQITVLDSLSMTTSRDTSICIGETVELEVNGTGGKSSNHVFSWSEGLGNGTQFSVSPLTTTVYQIELTDGCSNSSFDSIKVTVINKPLVDFSASDTVICAGDSIEFKNESVGINATVFEWKFGVSQSAVENPVVKYDKAGKYSTSLKVRNDAGCEGDISKVENIEVVEMPKASFTFFPLNPDFSIPKVDFTNNSQFASSYLWDFGDGTTGTSFNPSKDYGDTGRFQVILVATNALGCSSTYTAEVFVRDVFKLYLPNSFSPNVDNLNESYTPKGRGIVHFEMTILNRWGEIMFETKDMSNTWSGYAPGTTEVVPTGSYPYFIRVIDVNGKIHNFSGSIEIIR